MKKWIWIVILIIIASILFVMVFRPGGGGEDSWIQDENGIWIKHGVPRDTPPEVLEQQRILGLDENGNGW